MPAFRFIFTAQNYERSVTFYTKKLGLPVVTSWDEHGRGTIVAAAEGQIEIFAPGDKVAPRVSGAAIAWEVDEIDTRIDALRSAGVKVLEGPTDRPWGHRNATIEDPDGLRITLFSVLDPPT